MPAVGSGRATQTREDFMKIVTGCDIDGFLGLVARHNATNDGVDFGEFIETLPGKFHSKFWAGILEIASKAPTLDNAVDVLTGCTQICEAALLGKKITAPVEEFHSVVQLLHDGMFNFGDTDEWLELRRKIAGVCEAWWLAEMNGRESLMPQTLSHFLIMSLLPDTRKADVKRLYALRDGFTIIDLDDPSSHSLKALFLQCFMNHSFLHVDEGQKFLSFLFSLSHNFIADLHKVIKNQIPVASPTNLVIYGQVYFRAWRNADGLTAERIETGCLQDLIYHAVHAQRVGVRAMSKQLRVVLDQFHDHKKQKGVDECLTRLYNPILWRALTAANDDVRANAASLLIDAFPLQSLETESARESNELMQKQFDAIGKLLTDVSPSIRAIMAHGTCRILNLYWELLPTHVAVSLVESLVLEQAHDSSNANVRVAVLQGIAYLLQNHLAQPTLVRLLPALKNLVHDASEKVRTAMISVLEAIRGLRTIKFYTLVSANDLLARLEVDSAGIALRICKLLQPSFFPNEKSTETRIDRSLVLGRSNLAGLRRFFHYLPKIAAIEDIAAFIERGLQALVHACNLAQNAEGTTAAPVSIEIVAATAAAKKKTKKGGAARGAKKGKEEPQEETAASANTSVTATSTDPLVSFDNDVDICVLLEAVAVLVESSSTQLFSENGAATVGTSVEKCLSNALKTLLPAVQARDAAQTNSATWSFWSASWTALLCLARHIRNPSDELVEIVLQALSRVEENNAYQTNAVSGPLVGCLCSWDRTSMLVEQLTTWLNGVGKRTYDELALDGVSAHNDNEDENDDADDVGGKPAKGRAGAKGDKENGPGRGTTKPKRAGKAKVTSKKSEKTEEEPRDESMVSARPQLALATLELAMRFPNSREAIASAEKSVLRPLCLALRAGMDALSSLLDVSKSRLALTEMSEKAVKQASVLLLSMTGAYSRLEVHIHQKGVAPEKPPTHSYDDCPTILSEMLVWTTQNVMPAFEAIVSSTKPVASSGSGRKRKTAATEESLATSKWQAAIAADCLSMVLNFAVDLLKCGLGDSTAELQLCDIVRAVSNHLQMRRDGSLFNQLTPCLNRTLVQAAVMGYNERVLHSQLYENICECILGIVQSFEDETEQEAQLATLRPALFESAKIMLQIGSDAGAIFARPLVQAALQGVAADLAKHRPSAVPVEETDLVPVAALLISMTTQLKPLSVAILAHLETLPTSTKTRFAAISILSVFGHVVSAFSDDVVRAVKHIENSSVSAAADNEEDEGANDEFTAEFLQNQAQQVLQSLAS